MDYQHHYRIMETPETLAKLISSIKSNDPMEIVIKVCCIVLL